MQRDRRASLKKVQDLETVREHLFYLFILFYSFILYLFLFLLIGRDLAVNPLGTERGAGPQSSVMSMIQIKKSERQKLKKSSPVIQGLIWVRIA